MNAWQIAFWTFVLDLVLGDELRTEVFRTARIVNRGVNRWGRIWVTFPILVWVGGLYAFSANHFSRYTMMFFWLLPFAAALAAFVWWPTLPSVIAVAAKLNERLERGLNATLRGAGWILFVGLSFVAVPVWVQPEIALFVAGLIALVGIWDAGNVSYWPKFIKLWGRRFAVAVIIFLIISFFFGGLRTVDRDVTAATKRTEKLALSAKDKLSKISFPSVNFGNASTPAEPVVLDCDETNNTSLLHNAEAGVAYRAAISSNCTVTQWVVAPENTQRFRWSLSSNIMIQLRFADGRLTEPFRDSPTTTVRDSVPVRAIRFFNDAPSSKTVSIRVN